MHTLNVNKFLNVFCMLLGGIMLLAPSYAENINYQINGSFEYASNPDIPDYWCGMGNATRSLNGIPGDSLTEKTVKEFTEKFFLDESTAFHGKKSMRVQAPFFISSSSMDITPEKDYVMSVYLKSSRENMMVALSAVYMVRDKPYLTQENPVSTEWKRYEMKLPKYPNNKVSILVKPLDSGNLWVDAVQIEDGLQASPFKPAHYDDGFTKPQPLIHLGTDSKAGAPSVRIPAPSVIPPVIDGALESIWDQAVSLKMNTMMGAPSETPTQVKLLYDAANIYIAFECEDPRGAKGKGDSIEIFMDLLGMGSPYYQFVFDANGKQHQYYSIEGKHEWGWKTDWKVAAKENKKGWTAEAAIPFSVMPESKEVACMESLKMNFCRNYSAGPEIHLGWAPVHGTFLEPENFGTIFLSGDGGSSFDVKNLKLVSTDAPDNRFDLTFDAENNFPGAKSLMVMASLESKSAALQTRAQKISLSPKKNALVSFKGFRVPDDRCRAGLLILGEDGKITKQIRTFLKTPHPLKVYPEYSYYTSEESARLKVEFAGDMQRTGMTLRCSVNLDPIPRVLDKKEYPFLTEKSNIYTYPIAALSKAHAYTLDARLVDASGKEVAKASCYIIRRDPNHTELKVNHFNRGLYLNGKPYIPYGYQLFGLPDDNQLRYYKTLGHDYVCYTGHWGDVSENHRFLSICDQLSLNVMDFHAVRANADAPGKMLAELSGHKSLFATTPVDECVDQMVPGILADAKIANPYLLCYKNDNVAGYRYWRAQINGLPGEALSIDRYPLLNLAKGLPQTTSLIYTFERALEMMDEDGKRERKPVFMWMEGAESNSKEPTKEELTWFHYIAVVNHCMGYTYFGGVPMSRYARQTIRALDVELKVIQPFLFSFEEDPRISFGNQRSENLIRVLAKKLDNQLLVVCVSRATEEVDAEINLSSVLKSKSINAAVLFEGRSLKIGADLVLRDKFSSLGRHVYKISLGQ